MPARTGAAVLIVVAVVAVLFALGWFPGSR